MVQEPADGEKTGDRLALTTTIVAWNVAFRLPGSAAVIAEIQKVRNRCRN